MGYRWQNVRIDVNEDGSVDVSVEGRGPVLPHLDKATLEPGDSVRIMNEVHMNGQPTYEKYKGMSIERDAGEK